MKPQNDKTDLNGLFKDATFGDRYLTRDGRKAVFLHFWGNPPQSAIVYVEGYGQQECGLDGRVASGIITDRDIVKRCTGPHEWM